MLLVVSSVSQNAPEKEMQCPVPASEYIVEYSEKSGYDSLVEIFRKVERGPLIPGEGKLG